MIPGAIVFSIFGVLAAAASDRQFSRLVVISFDGFRYDFLERGLTPNLNSLKPSGTYARFMINVFPTQTFPNHFSIATGLYTEVHGVLANHVYNKTTKSVMNYGYPLFHYNEEVTPIWTLNQRAGDERHSGVMMWAGCDFAYGGVKTTFVKSFNESIEWKERVDTAIGWLEHPETPANLVMMYFEDPDSDEHVFGPESAQTDAQIKRTDDIAKYLMVSLRNNGLEDVNVVFLSDHGMDGVKESGIVDLTSLTQYEFQGYGSSPVRQIYPKYAHETDVLYEELKQVALKEKTFNVYKKDEIPEYFHYKKCSRVPPILAVTEPEHAFEDLYTKIQYYKQNYNVTDEGTFGVHGYDPLTLKMHPFFLAKGPIFKRNYTVNGTINNIDLYLLFAYVLGLELPPLKPNGTFANIAEVIASN